MSFGIKFAIPSFIAGLALCFTSMAVSLNEKQNAPFEVQVYQTTFLQKITEKNRAHAEKVIREHYETIFEIEDKSEHQQPILVEFFDYKCNYCKNEFHNIKAISEDFPEVKVIYKQFPILSKSSRTAAKAALAAEKQGKYVQMHEKLIRLPRLTEKYIFRTAEDLGLNVNKLKKDMSAERIMYALSENYELAKALKIKGTPAFVIQSKPDESGQVRIYYASGFINKKEMQALLFNEKI